MAAAAADSDPAAAVAAMSTCAHCQREIPSSNIDLHSVHCARNLQKCQHCGEMIPRKLMDEHYDENHAPINCSLCKETIERESWDLHKGEKCPQRIVACEYCEFELPAVDLHEHQKLVWGCCILNRPRLAATMSPWQIGNGMRAAACDAYVSAIYDCQGLQHAMVNATDKK
ncbi:unnamed protein product [Miscanthus lutarioriparius]|uniref:TRAF-type domain-containing protein n=1 Tax=Miscanthus lutarioriparius TaxID=422564 RepID=A0A811MNS5_9POAL|nr:unnamed protein product [Miscanthus lutarioriparius]